MIVLRKRITLLLCKKKVLRASIERTKRIIYLAREGRKANEGRKGIDDTWIATLAIFSTTLRLEMQRKFHIFENPSSIE